MMAHGIFRQECFGIAEQFVIPATFTEDLPARLADAASSEIPRRNPKKPILTTV